MLIQIQEVGKQYTEKNYAKFKLKYIRDGKEAERTMVAVGASKPHFIEISQAKQGDMYEVEMVKDDKGFFNWTKVTKASNTAPAVAATTATSINTKSTYETAEERARRQVLIVRQSSISNATDIVIARGLLADGQDVATILDVAEKLENWVFRKELPEFKDDIPY